MPNENKKSYREIAENNMIPRNTLLKDVYAKLEQTPEADIQARITEIREALLDVNNRTAKMQRRMMTKKELMEDKQAMAELEEISLIGTRLENEAEMLDYFPKVRATMQAIKVAQDEADLEVTDARETVSAQQTLLIEARKAAEKAIEAEEKAKEINAQIEELITDVEEAIAKGRKPKVIEGLQDEIDEKKAEIEALGTPEEWKKAIEEEGICETKLATSVANRDKKITKQAILANPWNTIIKDYLWTELGDLTSEDISKLVGTQVEKPEAKWEEKPVKKDDKDKDKDNDKGKGKDSGKGQNPNGSNNFPNPSGPQEPPKPDPEQEQDTPEQDPDEPEHDEEEPEQEGDNPDLPATKKHNIFVRMIPPLARWLDKTQEKENAFIEQFRKENKGNPSWFQKLKARFSKTAEAVEELSEEEKALRLAKGNVVQLESRIKAVELEIKNYETNKRNLIKDIIDRNDTDVAKETKAIFPNLELSEIRSIAPIYIARGDFTKKDMIELIEEKTTDRSKIEISVDEKDPDKKAYNDVIRSSISSQLNYLTVSQLEERRPYLEALEVYTPEEFRDIQTRVVERETREKDALNAKLAQAKADLAPAKEAEEQARQAYEASLVPPSRQAHRDFASQINGGEAIPTPEVEHVEAEMVREGDYARATSDSVPDIGDPFAEEPADADDGAR